MYSRTWTYAMVLAVAGWVCNWACPALQAQTLVYDDFEGPDTSWQEAGADVRYRLDAHRRTTDDARNGRQCEQLHITTGLGSCIYLSHAVPSWLVVDELAAGLWVKANRPGLQIVARVVLPHVEDRDTGKPLSVLIRGAGYTQVGNWQKLRITDVPRLLAREVRVLRVQLGPDIDVREAYLDRVLLNVYGGRGQTLIAIDDLEIAGAVERTANPDVIQASFEQPVDENEAVAPARQRDVRLQGSLLLVDGRPMLPRCVQYQGEPLEFLQGLGCNVVQLGFPPTREILREAGRLNLWLICPPPPVGDIGPDYAPVLAWDLGSGLTGRELSATTDLAKRVRLADRLRTRPLLCAPDTDVRAYSRHADILVTRRQPLGTSLELTDYRTWLREWPRLARPGTPVWSAVQTELPLETVQQMAALSGGQASPAGVDEDSFRVLVHAAIAAGSRGILFQSHSRLDTPDPATRRRASALELMNMELELLEPWAAAGSFAAMAASGDPLIKGAVLQTEKARLLLPIYSAGGSQYVARQSSGAVTFVVPGVPESHDVYDLTPAGVRPLRQKKRVAGGTLMAIDDFSLTSMVVVTADPLVVSSLSRRLIRISTRATELKRDLAKLAVSEVEQVYARLPARVAGTGVAGTIASARAKLDQCDRLLAAGDYRAAFSAATRGAAAAQGLKRTLWEQATAGITPASSPFAVSFSTLPQQWSLAEQIGAAQMGENRLTGGDFESLETMVGAGWQHFEHQQPEAKASVELSSETPHGGSSCLRMRVESADPAAPPALLETPPLWVTTGPVPVDAGAMVCIRGRVRIAAPITGSIDGLLILDSFGGEPLAQRIGQTNGWTEFVLLRAAPDSAMLTVTFALTGLGEAWIDDVTVQMVNQPMTAANASHGAMPGLN